MKPTSRAARIRAWLNVQDAFTVEKAVLPRQIIAGVQKAEREAGLPESTDLQIYWATGLMYRDGILDRSGTHHYARRYWLVREPVVAVPLTVEQKRARNAIRARERHIREGGKTRAQLHAEALERQAARKAARAQRLAEQEASIIARRQAEIEARAKRAEEKAKQKARDAALDRARALIAQMRVRQAAERQPKQPVPVRETPRPLEHLMPPPKPHLESSFEAEARGVKVERLPPGASSTPLKHFPLTQAA